MATVYLTEQRSVVRKEDACLVVHMPDKRKVEIPLLKVDQVFVVGDVTLTTPALHVLLESNIEVCFLTAYGRFRGRLAPACSKNAPLRAAQYRIYHDPQRALPVARAFVSGKLENLRTMLLRANRKLNDAEIATAAAAIKRGLEAIPHAPRVGALLGIEGAASAAYFAVFGKLLRQDLGFRQRVRRPPGDPVNALLSLGYTLLAGQVAATIHAVGLDPYAGFLHATRYGRPALALDIMEEFRPLIADSVALTMVNNRVVDAGDFRTELGSCQLVDAARKTFYLKFEERLNTSLTHPTFGYKATYRRCLELQTRLLAKWLMGEIPAYPPLTVR